MILKNHSRYLVYLPIWSVSRERRCSGAVRLGSVATTVEFDFVSFSSKRLRHGASYEVDASTTHVDAQFLVSTAVGLHEIRVTERGVILGRVDSGSSCPMSRRRIFR
jgi:hypothetical protein